MHLLAQVASATADDKLIGDLLTQLFNSPGFRLFLVVIVVAISLILLILFIFMRSTRDTQREVIQMVKDFNTANNTSRTSQDTQENKALDIISGSLDRFAAAIEKLADSQNTSITRLIERLERMDEERGNNMTIANELLVRRILDGTSEVGENVMKALGGMTAEAAAMHESTRQFIVQWNEQAVATYRQMAASDRAAFIGGNNFVFPADDDLNWTRAHFKPKIAERAVHIYPEPLWHDQEVLGVIKPEGMDMECVTASCYIGWAAVRYKVGQNTIKGWVYLPITTYTLIDVEQKIK